MNAFVSSPLPADLPVWSAPAKLNLFLHITGRREDGYHELQTIFQLLDYGDRIAVEVTDDPRIDRPTELAGVPAESDLMVRAAQALQKHCEVNKGCRIYIDKRLPMGGGVGGGSSDAATMLCALNRLWDCGLNVDALAGLGAQLGADVPVFVRGQTAWGEGVGEQLTPIDLPERWYVVLRPDVQISTPALFSSPELTRDCSRIKIRDFLASGGTNVFEPLVRKAYPEVEAAITEMAEFARFRLTGTGSCVFAEFSSAAQAKQVFDAAPEGLEGFVAEGVSRSLLVTEMESR